ncbi:1-deoxy-D-xylulose-5-phosphate reductoisomerase [Paracandidimonas soli]|uniref:1-deoxy-D-xylulose 5-phosphate reductoisomerase n=1 Tax=Paracandidimonas soli TaxID=1917182 RepID=A0A4R3VCC1_9BURK|nr:1-deoxy-D-xylulose-5-phosphate reductoisomerase [Paracandidimonas soli]TCV01781.1 1-deoxy-D-xylulose 5-phosphate reductoisomerase [Paracandidimonas soli]
MQQLCILGSTGSIGESTLDVVARHPDRLKVYALSAYSRMERLAAQAAQTQAAVVVVPTEDARQRFLEAWSAGGAAKPPEVRVGEQALAQTAAAPEVTSVMAAIVGAAGLPAAMAAAMAGKRILLANKEALVAAGGLFMKAVAQHGAQLLPIDSEHNAIFQCMPRNGSGLMEDPLSHGVRRLLLTASGGPFRATPLEQLDDVTPEQACAHPNWSMGRKISVDSATMLNKGLEVIEAYWLFSVQADAIEVVIHPQSMIHSMVEYTDGSILAQLGQPDMRTPIAYGLGFPERIDSGVGTFPLSGLARLDFQEPDLRRFPCLKLSFDALREGQVACIALNAANEVAVARFLDRKVRFTDIPRIISAVVEDAVSHAAGEPSSLEDVLALDRHFRTVARQRCPSRS